MQNLTGKNTGDTLSAAEWNQLPSEVQNVITQSGQGLSSGDLNQLGKAIAAYVANGDFYTDGGAANAYVLTAVGGRQNAPAYNGGFTVKFIAVKTNTGASTVNAGALGVKDLTYQGGDALLGGAITAGRLIEATFNSVGDRFEMVSPAATKTEMEAGTETGLRGMSPLRVAEAGVVFVENAKEQLKENVVGIFKANPASFIHRAGTLMYSKNATGEAKLVSDLTPFMPVGWRVRNPSDLPPGLKAYYVSRAGNNTTGLDWTNAFNSIATAVAQPDVDVVFVNGQDRFGITFSMGIYSGSRDIAIISVGGRAIVTPQTEETWMAGAEPNTFESTTTGGTIAQVLDPRNKDDNGDIIPLTKVNSAVEVSSLQGSWYYNGSITIVRLFDDATPDNENCWLMRGNSESFRGVSAKMYLYGLDYYSFSAGAFTARTSDIDSVIAVENCGFYNCYNGDGYQVKGVGLSIAIGCRASANFNDGFNYHAEDNNPLLLNPHFIEIDCNGIANLEVATGNGSTSHEEVVGFRLHTEAYDNNGRGIADVGDAKTFNVGITSNSNGFTGGSAAAWGVGVFGNAEMWLDGCSASNNKTNQVAADDTAILHYKDCYPAPVNESGTATIDQDFS